MAKTRAHHRHKSSNYSRLLDYRVDEWFVAVPEALREHFQASVLLGFQNFPYLHSGTTAIWAECANLGQSQFVQFELLLFSSERGRKDLSGQ